VVHHEQQGLGAGLDAHVRVENDSVDAIERTEIDLVQKSQSIVVIKSLEKSNKTNTYTSAVFTFESS
jgi:hypothetical protein